MSLEEEWGIRCWEGRQGGMEGKGGRDAAMDGVRVEDRSWTLKPSQRPESIWWARSFYWNLRYGGPSFLSVFHMDGQDVAEGDIAVGMLPASSF